MNLICPEYDILSIMFFGFLIGVFIHAVFLQDEPKPRSFPPSKRDRNSH